VESDNEAGGDTAQCASAGRNSPLNPPEDPIDDIPRPLSSGGAAELIFPMRLSASEKTEAARRVPGLEPAIAQEVLFELDGQMKRKEIQNPLGYLRALVASASSGTFRADLAPRAREAHARRVALESAMAREDSARPRFATPVNVDELPPRLRDIIAKHVRRACEVVPDGERSEGDPRCKT
jgi:hypothetical protein